VNGRNFLTNYANIVAADVRQHAIAYQEQNDRRVQNSNMLYHCLSKSISTDVHTKVTMNAARYNLPIPIGPDPNVPVEHRYDSVCFLKAIIDETYTNTLNNAAVLVARSNLTTLATYMKTLPDSNITEFNAYVKRNTQELAAANETTNDLLVNLFNGYRECKDKCFRDWITRIEDDWLFCRLQLANDGLALLELTENYYKDHVMRSLWVRLDEDQEATIALKAQLKQQKQPRQQPKTNRNTTQKARTDAWKLQPPRKGEPHKKTVTINGKDYTYRWCHHHRKWTAHHPKDCMLANKDNKNKNNTGKEKKEKAPNKEDPTLKVMAAALKEIEEANSDSSIFNPS